MLKQLKGDGTAVDEADLVAWANAKVAAFAGATQPPIRSLNDKKLATGRFCVELCAAVGGDVVDWDLVTPGATDEDRALNAKYALSIARKVGARVFCTPDDIVEVKPKMILLFIAALWQAELSGATRPSPFRASSAVGTRVRPKPKRSAKRAKHGGSPRWRTTMGIPRCPRTSASTSCGTSRT